MSALYSMLCADVLSVECVTRFVSRHYIDRLGRKGKRLSLSVADPLEHLLLMYNYGCPFLEGQQSIHES